MSYWWKEGHYWRSADKAAAQSEGRRQAQAETFDALAKTTAEAERLRRRVETLEGRLARVLGWFQTGAMQGRMRSLFASDYGRVWSRGRSGSAGGGR